MKHIQGPRSFFHLGLLMCKTQLHVLCKRCKELPDYIANPLTERLGDRVTRFSYFFRADAFRKNHRLATKKERGPDKLIFYNPTASKRVLGHLGRTGPEMLLRFKMLNHLQIAIVIYGNTSFTSFLSAAIFLDDYVLLLLCNLSEITL